LRALQSCLTLGCLRTVLTPLFYPHSISATSNTDLKPAYIQTIATNIKLLLIMKRLLLYTIKSIITNPAILGWGILFMLFWGIMGAYVEGPSLISQLSSSLKQAPTTIQHNTEQTVYLQYTSGWYADLVILSLSAIGTGVAFILYYQTGTLPYLIRYSKLTTTTYFTSLYSGNLIASFILEALLTAVTVYMFSNNGVGISATPSKIEIIILTILLSSIFFVYSRHSSTSL